MAVSATSQIKIAFIGDTSSFQKSTAQADRIAGKFAGTAKTHFSGIGKSLLGLAGTTLAVKEGFDFLSTSIQKAAAEDVGIAKLGRVLQNAGASQQTIKANERWITSLQNATGVADEELRPALAKLVSANIPLNKAQKLLAQGLDISAAKGKPLATVVLALSKAYNGNRDTLGRLGLVTKDASGKALTFDQILKNASKTMGGTAAAAAKTAGGQMAILKAKFNDVQEEIGRKLLPVLNAFVAWFSKNLPKFEAFFKGVIGGGKKFIDDLASAFHTDKSVIVAAIGGIGVALVGLAIAWNLGPGVIITGIALLVAGLLYCYNRFAWFRGGVAVLMGQLAGIVQLDVAAIKFAIAGITAVTQVASAAFQDLYDTASVPLGALLSLLQQVYDTWSRIKNFGDPPSQNLAPGPRNAPHPGSGGTSFAAAGGIFPPRPGGWNVTLAEAGKTEAVIPLDGRHSLGGGTTNVYVTVQGGDPEAVVRAIKKYEQRNGKGWRN